MVFTQLLDRALASDVVLASWCPTMDLLALVMSDSQLSVNRLNKQRLWVLAPDSKITAMTWQPDGKLLAIALQGGGIWLLDVENGEARRKEWEQEPPVLCLTWTEEDTAATRPGRTPLVAATAGPRCCHRARAGPADKGAGTFSPDGRPPGVPDLPSHLSVLCAGNESAAVRLLAFGSFPLGRVALPGPDPSRAGVQQQPAVRILHAEMTPDLSRLCSLSVSEAGGEVGCVIHDMGCIGHRCAELRHIAVLASHVGSLLKWCNDACEAAHKEWQGAMAAVGEKMEEFRGLLVSYGIVATAEEELQAVLATGILTPAMQHFLSTILGEANLKRLARVVDGAVGALGRLLVEQVACSLEAAALQLDDALGLARCSPWMAPLSLQEVAVGEAAVAAQALVLRVEALRRAVLAAGAQYRALFAWLLTLCRRVNEDAAPVGASGAAFQADPHALATFIRGPFCRDVIGPQLDSEAPEAVPPLEAQEGPGLRALLGQFGCAAGYATEAPLLRHGLSRLAQQCQGVFDGVQQSMAPSMQPLLSVRLATLCQPSLRFAVMLPQVGAQMARMCFLAEPGGKDKPESLLFVDICGSSQEQQSPLQVVSTVAEVQGWGHIADIASYKDEQLAVLTGSGGDMEEAHFVLLPLGAISEAPSSPSQAGVPGAASSQVCKEAGRVQLGVEGLQKRALGHAQATAPLAVSGSRGVACTPVGLQRIVILDLEEEEDDDDAAGISEDGQSNADDS